MSLREELQHAFGGIDGVQWIDEAAALASQISQFAPVARTYDHALLVGDRFLAMAGPLEEVGYTVGGDETLYLGEVGGLRYVGIAAALPATARARSSGWFDYVLISQPAHQPAYEHVRKTYGGGPILHHVALTLESPAHPGESDEDYALRVVPEFLRTRARVSELTGARPQKMTLSVPEAVAASARFQGELQGWLRGGDPSSVAVEVMAGGGFFLQFSSTESYRVEVVIRHATKLGFNPVAQTKLSRDVSYST